MMKEIVPVSFCFIKKANNLYGYAMSQRLPIGGYKWLSERKIARKFNTSDERKNAASILELEDDSEIGYIFEVDLHYPAELHATHNDFSFCPERRGLSGITTNDKLLLTFFDRKNYIVHYSMLKLALEHGLKLQKVHRVLKFKQTAWLKPYIELNTAHRTHAENEFEKDFYKLLNNAIYGMYQSCQSSELKGTLAEMFEWRKQK